MKRVLILGGGFGGLATAHTLRELRPDDEVIVVDRETYFMVGFRKTWALLGMGSLDGGRGYLPNLEKFGITFRHGTVMAIDPETRTVEVDGERLEADAIVVALGARLADDEIPGFSDYALNVYDPMKIPQVREALQRFSGGRVVVGVFGLPYKCPPAPYEIALLTKEFFANRRVEATVEVFTPLPMTLPIVGTSGCDAIEGRLVSHGVTFLPNHTAVAVEEGEVIFQGGR
ncbi:MAG: NAD(P)/FAD-dependent oxidoreductase [Chloroflexota bacterium]|nr:NAD(P)/FAD-dependent oxidoreductase [Chloroflexota bacterium]